jgi:hypothetical protein
LLAVIVPPERGAAASPALLFNLLFVLLAVVAAVAIATEDGTPHFVAATLAPSPRPRGPPNIRARSLYAAMTWYGVALHAVPLVAERLGRRLTHARGTAIALVASIALVLFLAIGPVARLALGGIAILLGAFVAILFLPFVAGPFPFFRLVGITLAWVVLAVWWMVAMTATLLLPALAVVGGIGPAGGGRARMARRAQRGAQSRTGVRRRVRRRRARLPGVRRRATRAQDAALAMARRAGAVDLAIAVGALVLRDGAAHLAAVVASQLVVLLWSARAVETPWPRRRARRGRRRGAGLRLDRPRPTAGVSIDRFGGAAVAAVLLAVLIAIRAAEAAGAPGVAFIAAEHAVLGVALLAVAEITGWHRLRLLAVAAISFASALWVGGHVSHEAWASGFVVAAVPFVVLLADAFRVDPRSAGSLRSYQAATVSGVVFLALARYCIRVGDLEQVIGIVPVVQALAFSVLVRRVAASGSPERDRDLALVAAATLGFATAAIPLQLSLEHLTVALALEATALAWLYRRIRFPQLVLWIAGLAVAVFVRLTINPEVLTYHAWTGAPIFNWYLYVYLVSAAALGAAAALLRDTDDRIPGLAWRLSELLPAAATLLLFILVNIEIADFYSTGQTLTFNFSSASLAQDLTYTLAWAVFAIGLLAAGIRIGSRGVRGAALGLLVVTILKCFVRDLWRLGGLYRVGSFVGLAICLSVVAVLLQRFVFPPRGVRGVMRRAGLAWLFVAATVAAAAPPSFRHMRPVLPGALGANRLVVDATLLTGARPLRFDATGRYAGGLEDLRLASGDGSEVPYLVLAPPASERTWRGGSIQAIAPSEDASGFEIDLSLIVTVDRMRLSGLPAPMLKRARLEGSGDRERWVVLADATSIFDLPEDGLRRLEVGFDAAPLRFVRLIWDDRATAQVPLPAAVALRTAEVAAPPSVFVPVAFERRANEPGTSRFRILLPGPGLPIRAFELDCGGEHLLRPARVHEPQLTDDAVTPRELGAGVLRRVTRTGVTASDLRIAVTTPHEVQFELVVDDADNPPLVLRGIRAELPALPTIYFESPDGVALTAKFGAPALAAPRYDLEAARGSLQDVPAADARWATHVASSARPGRTSTRRPGCRPPARRSIWPRSVGARFRGTGTHGASAGRRGARPLGRARRRSARGRGRTAGPTSSSTSASRSWCRCRPVAPTPGRGRSRGDAPGGAPHRRLPDARLVLETSERVFDRRIVVKPNAADRTCRRHDGAARTAPGVIRISGVPRRSDCPRRSTEPRLDRRRRRRQSPLPIASSRCSCRPGGCACARRMDQCWPTASGLVAALRPDAARPAHPGARAHEIDALPGRRTPFGRPTADTRARGAPCVLGRARARRSRLDRRAGAPAPRRRASRNGVKTVRARGASFPNPPASDKQLRRGPPRRRTPRRAQAARRSTRREGAGRGAPARGRLPGPERGLSCPGRRRGLRRPAPRRARTRRCPGGRAGGTRHRTPLPLAGAASALRAARRGSGIAARDAARPHATLRAGPSRTRPQVDRAARRHRQGLLLGRPALLGGRPLHRRPPRESAGRIRDGLSDAQAAQGVRARRGAPLRRRAGAVRAHRGDGPAPRPHHLRALRQDRRVQQPGAREPTAANRALPRPVVSRHRMGSTESAPTAGRTRRVHRPRQGRGVSGSGPGPAGLRRGFDSGGPSICN